MMASLELGKLSVGSVGVIFSVDDGLGGFNVGRLVLLRGGGRGRRSV